MQVCISKRWKQDFRWLACTVITDLLFALKTNVEGLPWWHSG